MQKIGPCLWFDGAAEEAAQFYVSVFPNARIVCTTHYVESTHRPIGSVMTVEFVLDGQEFVALNGGPYFDFSPAISMVVPCDTQAQLDHLWSQLMVGGHAQQCGWLTDKFGVSWQILPKTLTAMMQGDNTAAAQRAMAAMLQMVKLDIAALEQAYHND